MTTEGCLIEEDVMAAATGATLPAAAQAHLAGCPRCRGAIEELRTEMSTMRIALSGATTIVGTSPAAPTPGPDGEPAYLGKYFVAGRVDQSERDILYRGTHSVTHVDVLIRLGRERMTDPAVRKQLLDEGRKLSILEHKHLVTVRDMDFFDGRPFLVSELIRGPDLAEHLAGRPMSARQAAEWAAKLAGAVAVAHGRGLAHGDIRPVNIRVDGSGEPRLAGWGGPLLTRSSADAALTAAAVRDDVLRLGEVLFLLLTGRKASVPASPAADREALRAAAAPPALESLCLRAQSNDTAARPENAGEMERELNAFVGGGRGLLWAALAAGTLLLAGAVWLLVSLSGRR